MPEKPNRTGRTSRTNRTDRTKRTDRTRTAGRSGQKTIDEFLAAVADDEKRAALEKLRKTIRKIAPKAEECISYGIAAFRLEGRVIAGFSAGARFCSYFPFSGSTLGTLAKELAQYDRTKSALHFQPDEPLPVPLVRKLIKARLAEG
ncbi:MAG: DUF1801 domain-containing protein [Myxococcales bacterium]